MADAPAPTRLCPSCGNEVPAEANAHDPTVPREPSQCPVCDYPLLPPPMPAGGGVRATTGLLAEEFRQPGAAVVAVVLVLIGLGAIVGVASLIGHGPSAPRGTTALSPA